MVSRRQALVTFAVHADDLAALVPQLMARVDEFARSLLASEKPDALARQMYLIGRTQLLLSRMQERFEQLSVSDDRHEASNDALSRDSEVLESTLIAWRDGNEDIGIEAISHPAARVH